MRPRMIIATTALAMAACVGSARTALGKEGKMKEKAEIFRRIDALAKVAHVRPAAVANALGAELAFKKDESIDYLDVEKAGGPGGSWIKSVEVRVSKDGSPGGMALVDLAPDAGVSLQDVLKKYGKGPRITYPSAHEPADSPVGYSYQAKGQELRFLVGRDGKRLVSVVLDRP